MAWHKFNAQNAYVMWCDRLQAVPFITVFTDCEDQWSDYNYCQNLTVTIIH